MNMQENNLQQLMIVCQQMAESGTPPSVGLLRARAPFKVSVTQAIEAIKRFNAANGTASKQVTEKPKETIASLTKRVQSLEKTVEKLLETIQQLSEK